MFDGLEIEDLVFIATLAGLCSIFIMLLIALPDDKEG